MNVIIFDFNRTLFDPELDCLIPGARKCLFSLSANNKLFILGRGDSVRRKKIETLDIEKFFQEVYIIEEKDVAQIKVIKNKFPPITSFYSIGDRIKKEIKLGNQMGCKTIWFKNGKFSSEVPSEEGEYPWKTITSLYELGDIFKDYL